MTVLYIFLGIILLIAILMLCNVKIIAQFSDYFSAEVKYLFVRIQLMPPDEKKKKTPKKKSAKKKSVKKKEKKEDKEKKEPFLKKLYSERGFKGAVNFLKELSKKILGIVGRLLKRILKHIVFDDIIIHMTVAGKDAAQTAIQYGKLSAIVFPLVSELCALSHVKRYDINIHPDFIAGKSEAEVYARLHIRVGSIVWSLLAAAFSAIWSYIKLFKFRDKKSKVNNDTEERVGI